MNKPLEDLLDQVRLLRNRIVEVAQKLHEDEPVTIGMRAVLEFLLKNGPTTVPDIARTRSVSRQHVQTLVNSLIGARLVALEENPLHKRSSLVRMTSEGERTIRRMKAREDRFYAKLGLAAKSRELERAARTLEQVREALDTEKTP